MPCRQVEAKSKNRMEQQDSIAFLQELGEVMKPEEPVYALPTGWLVVIAAGVVLVLAVLVVMFRNYRRNAYRRNAIKTIQSMGQLTETQDFALLAIRTNQIVKMVAMQSFGRKRVAALTGASWFELLSNTASSVVFAESSEQIIRGELYRSKTFNSDMQMSDIEAFILNMVGWIKTHDRHA